MFNEPDKSAFFRELKDLILDYIRIKLELTRIAAFEKIARIVTYLILGISGALLLFYGFLFLSLVLADYLSILFSSKLAGYASVALIYFLLAFWVIRSGNGWLGRTITNGIIRILFDHKTNQPPHETGKDS